MPSISELNILHQRLKYAKFPEEIFGVLTGTPVEMENTGRSVYYCYARLSHEDHYEESQKPHARATFQELNRLWSEAKQRILNGAYGTTKATIGPNVVIKTKQHVYTASSLLATGDKSNLYLAVNETATEVIVKISRSHTVNDLLETEVKHLTSLQLAATGTEKMVDYYPLVVDSGLVRETGSLLSRRVTVFSSRPGFMTLEKILQTFPEGLDGRHIVWLGNRLWTALAFAHNLGLIHGALLPSHLLVHPGDHGLMLVDWGASVGTGERVSVISPAFRDWYPIEIASKSPTDVTLDIYMAARCLFHASQDGVRLDYRLKRILVACLLPNPARRSSDAWSIFDAWQDAALAAYGPRKFVKLELTHG